MSRDQKLIGIAAALSVLLLALAGLDSIVQGDPAAVSQPAATRQAIFDIPFRINAPPGSAGAPTKAQLWVSADYGRHWDLYTEVRPEVGRFTFHAGVDGEYWFRIRTLNNLGNPDATAGKKPGLRVIVDTTIPQVDLQAYSGQGGQVTAVWKVDELNPQPATLTLQYRASETAPWQQVALGPKNREGGYVTWIPQIRGPKVEVRLEVNDRAGNTAIRLAQVEPSQVQPTGVSMTDNTQVNTAYSVEPSVTVTDQTHRAAGSFVERRPEVSPQVGNFDTTASVPVADSDQAAKKVNANAAPQGPIEMTARAGQSPATVLPDGEQLRMVNSRIFPIHYEIMPACPSGVRRVELFSTENGGLTWRSHQLDSDRRSPMQIHVKDEGIFGFRMVVTSGAGQGGQTPRSGDLPELSVGVDLTKPKVEIKSVDEGDGVERGKLVLRWQALDRLLSARPISIYYGKTVAGPWIPLVKGLENTGRFAWSVDNRMQGGVYFRIEARDEAGNVGVSDITKVTSITSAPTIRIRDEKTPPVEPMSKTAERRVGRSSY